MGNIMQVLASDRAPKVRNMSGQGIALVSVSKKAPKGCKPETSNHISHTPFDVSGLQPFKSQLGTVTPGVARG